MNESIPFRDENQMLRMSPWEFDQGPNGWRKLEAQREFVKAADLITEYINANKEKIESAPINETSVEKWLLCFHRGQLLASAGQEHWPRALESLSASFNGDECWDAYVSATMGFLEGNAERVEQAIETISSAKQEEKRQGNIGIVRNFKKALQEGVRDYVAVYSWPRDVTL